MISKSRPTKGKIGTPYHIEKTSYNKIKNMEHVSNEQLAKTMKNAIESGYDLKVIAKSLNTSLYNALLVFNDRYGGFLPMNDKNIKRLLKYGLSRDRIADLYNVDRSYMHTKSVKKANQNKMEKPQVQVKEKINKIPCNKNASIVKIASNSACDLCKGKNNVNIYYIDENKDKDRDSILNMICLCNKCRNKVTSNTTKYESVLKEIAKSKIDAILALADE
ncbi:hypothetical protein [Cetobacterium sp.]|uniref:hypothetical protein n=1 Tax=Cetobacterium sp. TaxID=2071632 RepID=UPI002FC623EA